MFKLGDSDKILSKTQYTSVMSIESLDGLNSGVPTRTTPTLTPSTLRNIEQAFQECQAEPHQNQARFVPPLVQPSTQVLHKSGSFMSVVDTKSWQGGRVTESPHSVPVEMFNTSIATTQPRRNVGGRRPIKDKSISPEEEERRAVRRERNKLAAARCRKRRLDHTNELVLETEGLQDKKKGLENELAQLKLQKQELEFLLDNHRPCKLNRELKDEDDLPQDPQHDPLAISGKENEMDNIPKISTFKKAPGKRPTTLSVSSYLPATTMDGGPTPTPTNGIFNFESLMEGGTGLTPVSAPLVPSCSTQQRNAGCVDLSSPDSGKLVSL